MATPSFRRLRDRLTGLPEHADVLGHRLDHQVLGLLTRGPGSDDPGRSGEYAE